MSLAEKLKASRPPRWRGLRRFVLIVLVTYATSVGFLMIFEESMIFFPWRHPHGVWNPPGLEFEDATFTSADGTSLHGWYVPHPQPRAVVLFAGGNAGNVTQFSGMLKTLQALGVSTLAFDYRGYGRSHGKPNESGVLADTRAARAWLAKRAGIDERDVVLMGRSLGGGVVVDLAARDGARGLIVESTFTSIPDVAAVHYPLVPVRWLMRTRLDSVSKIAYYHGPLLISHGNADKIVPFELGEQLFAAANEPKQFYVIAGGDHNDSPPEAYYRELDKFFASLPSDPGKAR